MPRPPELEQRRLTLHALLVLPLTILSFQVFQCLLQENENGGGEDALRDARPFLVSSAEFANFLARHAAYQPIAEDNSAMRNSYVNLDERLRVLDCSSGSKVPRDCVLDGVEAALQHAGFDQEMFVARGGIYDLEQVPPAPGPAACGGPLLDLETISLSGNVLPTLTLVPNPGLQTYVDK